MKEDKIESLISIFDHVAIKIIVVCLVCTLGVAFPILIQIIYGGPIHENYIHLGGRVFIFFPFYISIVASTTGWWALIAGPISVVLIYRIILYLRDDRTHIEILNLFTLSFYSTLIVVNPHWITGLIVAGGLGYLCCRLAKYNEGDRNVL